MCVYICVRVYMHACVCMCVLVCMCVGVHVCVCVYVCCGVHVCVLCVSVHVFYMFIRPACMRKITEVILALVDSN